MIPTAEAIKEAAGSGLVRGMGAPSPGARCILSAVSWAAGEGHHDAPSCIAPHRQAFLVRLNDASWSSAEARLEGMLPLAMACLGTAGESDSDRQAWVEHVAIQTVRQVLPLALRAVGQAAQAEACESASTLAAANAAANASKAGYASNAAYANASKAGYASNAAYAAASNAGYAAYAAAANAADTPSLAAARLAVGPVGSK